MAERGNSPVASIFDGTVEIICKALGLPARQKLEEISTDLKKLGKLSDTDLPPRFTEEIVSSLFKQIEGNWRGRFPSPKNCNCRLRRRTGIRDKNYSLEKVLEYAIATLAELRDLPEWHNQIPVASGLVGQYSDRHANIDLVRMHGNNTAELIELKWKSDTPLYALFQILRYGLALLFSRINAEKFGYRGRLIEAPVVKLAVLAPSQYYDGYDCRKYADVVNNGLQLLLRLLRDTHSDLPEMSFRFLRFPSCICIDEPLFNKGAEVKALEEKEIGYDDPRRVKLRKAMRALEPVIWDS